MKTPVRIAVIGLRFGGQVHVPAFRLDRRCQVALLVGRQAADAEQAAHALDVPAASSDWSTAIASPEIDAVSIAVPPALQPTIVQFAARHRKHVFCEKPAASSVDEAHAAYEAVEAAGIAHAIDFMFPEIECWAQARSALSTGVIGEVEHFTYTWRVETYASRMRLQSWKTRIGDGGGALGNFGSHVFYNIEWLLGPIESIDRFSGATGLRTGNGFDAALTLSSGPTGVMSVCTDAFLGTGHRIEIYGRAGTLVLENATADYASGFTLRIGTRKLDSLPEAASLSAPTAATDGRIAAVARVARRFIDAIHDGGRVTPSLADGLRVQRLMAQAAAAGSRGGNPLEASGGG